MRGVGGWDTNSSTSLLQPARNISVSNAFSSLAIDDDNNTGNNSISSTDAQINLVNISPTDNQLIESSLPVSPTLAVPTHCMTTTETHEDVARKRHQQAHQHTAEIKATRRSACVAQQEEKQFLDMTAKAVRAKEKCYNPRSASASLVDALDSSGLIAQPAVPLSSGAYVAAIALACGASSQEDADLARVRNDGPLSAPSSQSAATTCRITTLAATGNCTVICPSGTFVCIIMMPQTSI